MQRPSLCDQLLPWNIRLIAAVSPRWASEITSLIPVRPRSFCCAEALLLAVTHGDAEHLAVADRHNDGPRNHLHVLAQAAVELGGVEVDEGKRAWSKGLPRKALTCSTVLLADAAHLRFGDARCR